MAREICVEKSGETFKVRYYENDLHTVTVNCDECFHDDVNDDIHCYVSGECVAIFYKVDYFEPESDEE